MKIISLAACAAAASAAIFQTAPAQAENLAAYAATCAQQLGLTTIPGYSCSSGTAVSSANLSIATSNNRLGRVTTSNPNVDAVFLCRNFNGSTSGVNGYILQNTVTGNTCFFDAVKGASGTVPAPTAGNASSFWSNPNQMDGPCQTCHASDPFINTLGLSSAMSTQGMMKRGRNLMGAYNIVGSTDPKSFFSGWDAQRQITKNSCSSTGGCHHSSSTANAQRIVNAAVNGNWMANSIYQNPTAEAVASIAVWRPGKPGAFFYDRDNSRSWNNDIDLSGDFGETGDKPVVIKGTNCATGPMLAEFGTVRGNTWFITKNNLFWDSPADDANTFTFGSTSGKPASWNGVAVSLQSDSFVVDYNNDRAAGGDVTFPFGLSRDQPVIGRWSRGVSYRMGTYRGEADGLGYWALDLNGNNVWDGGDISFHFGDASDIPFTGDFNGDGRDEIGVFRDGTWFVDMNNDFVWNGVEGGDAEWSFGEAGDIPVVSPGKWDCSW